MMNTKPITSFRGEYYFLSNFSHTPFRWQGIDFDSGEQAFSWAKTKFAPSRVAQPYAHDILNCTSPGEAKRFGRRVPIDVKEWDKHKVMQMREIIHAKFSTAEGVVGPLCNTGAAMLVEGNDWNDKFWGRCLVNGEWVGLNILGSILMEERGYWTRERIS